jgi:integrase
MPEMLTQKAVERLRSGDKRIERPAGLVPGLYLVVQPSGAKSWCVRYRSASGKPVKLTLGRFPVLSLQDARERARAALLEVGRGADPHKEKVASRAAAKRARAEGEPVDRDLFPVVLDRFLAAPTKKRKEPRRARTVNEWRRMLDKDVTPRWRDKRVTEITKFDVRDALEAIETRGGRLTVNRVYSALLALFNFAVRKDIITASPMIGLEKPMAEESRDRVLTDSELKGLWLGLDEIPYPLGPFTKVLLLTGARRDEIASMTWTEIDKEARAWLLPAARSKNRKEKLVPLSEAAVAVINSITPIASDAGYVFTVTGNHPFNTFNAGKRKLDQVTGVSNWTFHDLRRTCASTLQRLRFQPVVCEAVLGHRTATGVAAVYQRHDYADEKRAALDAWARFLIDNAEGKKMNNVVDLAGRRA